MDKLKSRKFLLALASALVILLKGLGVVDFRDDAVWQLIAIVLGWIGVEGVVDFVRALRQYTVIIEDEAQDVGAKESP
jgi:hypothetical protein